MDFLSPVGHFRVSCLLFIIYFSIPTAQGYRESTEVRFSPARKAWENEGSSSWSHDMDKVLFRRNALEPLTNDKIPTDRRTGRRIHFLHKNPLNNRGWGKYGGRPGYLATGRRPFRRYPNYWSTPYKPGKGPSYKYFPTVESHVLGETIDEYYRNLANLPDFIRDYQSSYLETPVPPEESKDETPHDDHFQNYEQVQQDQEHSQHPIHDEENPRYSYENHGNHENQENRGNLENQGNDEIHENGGNHENQGNYENQENRGNLENQGNYENQENRGNFENQGNYEIHGNRENHENQGNYENEKNQENRGNHENRWNYQNHENRGNQENQENQGNYKNQENQENRGNFENQGNYEIHENRENHENQGNYENQKNQENRGNHENRWNYQTHENRGNQENQENRENHENQGNYKNQENRGNHGHRWNYQNHENRENYENRENRGNHKNRGNDENQVQIHQNQRPWDEMMNNPNNPTGGIKYSGCKNELQVPLSPPPFLPLPPKESNRDEIPEFIKFPDFHSVVQIEPIMSDVPSAAPQNAKELQTEDENFEKRYPQIFGEVGLPVQTGMNMTGLEQSKPDMVIPINVTSLSKPVTPPPPTTTSTTPSPEDKVTSVPVISKEGNPPSSLDMSASISTEVHLDESQDANFKRILLDQLIHRLKVMEMPVPFIGIPPVRRNLESGQGWTWKSDRSKELKILKSAIRKILIRSL